MKFKDIKTMSDAREYVKQMRLANQMDRYEAAQKYGCTYTSVLYYESGQRLLPLEYVLFWRDYE